MKIQGGLTSPAFLSETTHSFSKLLGLMGDDKQEKLKDGEKTKLPQHFYPHGFDASDDDNE